MRTWRNLKFTPHSGTRQGENTFDGLDTGQCGELTEKVSNIYDDIRLLIRRCQRMKNKCPCISLPPLTAGEVIGCGCQATVSSFYAQFLCKRRGHDVMLWGRRKWGFLMSSVFLQLSDEDRETCPRLKGV